MLERVEGTDLFEWYGTPGELPERCKIAWVDDRGRGASRHDPYCFPPQLDEFDLHLFGEGKHWHAYQFLGAHLHRADGVDGVLFAVWAPNAERVSVVGDFNAWDGRVHPMRSRGAAGVWELFIPEIEPGSLYRFELRTRDGEVVVKNDPYANQFQKRPENASLITAPSEYQWQDQQWLAERGSHDWQNGAMSIYEIWSNDSSN